MGQLAAEDGLGKSVIRMRGAINLEDLCAPFNY